MKQHSRMSPRLIFWLSSASLVLVVLVWCFPLPALFSSHVSKAAQLDRNSSLDVLLGGKGRQRHAAALAQRTYAGKTYSWKQYADWGKELLTSARVLRSPVGNRPSQPLARTYRCVNCHNLAREDPIPSKQDPDARELLLRKQALANPAKRDGITLGMTPATTLWGAVQRTSFYNGYYAKYHQLRLPNGQRMNPKQLADAIQICCRYCSSGRFAEPWELDSILTYLWDLEVRLKDLQLPPATEAKVLTAFNSGNASTIAQTRALLQRSYLQVSSAKLADLPSRSRGLSDLYADGTIIRGSAKAGKFLYQSACASCHGNNIHRASGARLLRDSKHCQKLILRGTEHVGLYMPLFTKQRLSRKQLADIRVYLNSLR